MAGYIHGFLSNSIVVGFFLCAAVGGEPDCLFLPMIYYEATIRISTQYPLDVQSDSMAQ
jgi:hypothetical protein